MQDTKAILKNYIDKKINDGTDKEIPFSQIPKSLKLFWEEKFNDLTEEERLIYKSI
jgi:hypothetical protein